MTANAKTIAVSGGFDPIHAGHVALIQQAALYGDVIVILNSDEWLIRKKGYYFQTWADRAAIAGAIAGVVDVQHVDDSDGTVCEALARVRPDFFANGGDRASKNTPEEGLCLKLGIEPVYGIGGGKYASSSFIPARSEVNRLWGQYKVIAEDKFWKLKTIKVRDGQSTSLQLHKSRAEHFVCVNGTGLLIVGKEEKLVRFGDYIYVPSHEWHQIQGITDLELIEVQVGHCIEDDITRV